MSYRFGRLGRAVMMLAMAACLAAQPVRAAGHLDPTFGTDGALVAPTGATNAETGSRAVAIGTDGKIVALASGSAGSTVVARYTANGVPDPTFGVGGKVSLAPSGPFAGIGVAVRGGRIVVSGFSNASGSPDTPAVVCLTATGALDATFGVGGVAITPIPGTYSSAGAWRPAIAADGSVVVAGRFNQPNSEWRAFVARYDANGVLDPTYGSGGIAVVPITDTVALGDMALQSDGRVVVVGGIGPELNPSTLPYASFYVLRLDATGNPDGTFGSGGLVTGAIDGYFEGVAVQSDGSITAGGAIAPIGQSMQLVFERFLADGSPDPGFGTNGVATYAFADGLGAVRRVLIQPDGRIVGVGSHINYWWRPMVARLEADGHLDPSFGLGGLSIWPFWNVDGTVPPGESLFVNDAALAPTGEIVTADGMYLFDDAPPPAVRLHRFLGTGVPCDGSLAIAGARITMTGFGLPVSKRTVSFKGKVMYPGNVPLSDPGWTTFGMVVTDATGATVFEEVVPAINDGGLWSLSDRKASYTTLDAAKAVRRVRLTRKALEMPATVKGLGAHYGVGNPVLPLTVTLLLDRSRGVCATKAFVPAECQPFSSRVKCQ